MASVITEIYKTLDEGKPAICIFVDLAKAFDTVSHEKLLETLENIGFRGMVLNLMQSYLSNRQQCVAIDNCISTKKIVKCGVPQGTVLGPLLFNIYVNDLYNLNTQGDIVSFADDTAIFYKGQTWLKLKEVIEQDFVKIAEWFNNRILTINFSKTFFVPFSCYQDTLPEFDNLQITMNQKQITIMRKHKIKYLGIVIDSHLRWNHHVEYVVQKIRGLLGKFKICKQIFSEKQLKTFYYSLVQSHLTYGILVWEGVTNNHLKNLETMQKWIIKIMYGRNHIYPTDALFAESKIWDMRQLFFHRLIIRHHKYHGTLSPISHQHNTRFSSKTTQIPKVKKTISQRYFTYLCPIAYAEIPQDIRETHSLNVVKKKLNAWLADTHRKKIHQIIDRKNIYIL